MMPEILWIDSDPAAIAILQLIYKDRYVIDQARTTEKAIEMALKKHYNIIVTDLPADAKKDDIHFICEIKKHSNYRNTPVIAASASLCDYSNEFLNSNGFLYCISKPFSIKELTVIFKKLLEADTLIT